MNQHDYTHQRFDTQGRDVTDTPGLWDERDKVYVVGLLSKPMPCLRAWAWAAWVFELKGG